MTYRRAGLWLALAWSLAACRPRIEAIEAPARAPGSATAPAQLRACWVETSRAAGFTASALVVRHPAGDLLIDGGNSTNFNAEIAVYGAKDRRWFQLLPGNLKPRRPLSTRLREAGVDPAGLRWLLPTHAHLDHLGGFLDLPATPVLLAPAEIETIERGRKTPTFEVTPAHAESVAPRAVPIDFAGGRYEIFDRHADLFGDGSVVVVPLSGHTPGSVGVFVNLPDGRRIFHVGDAVNNRRQISNLRGRSPGLRRTDSSGADADHVVGELHELSRLAPEIEIVPAHERRAWKDAFGQVGAGCG